MKDVQITGWENNKRGHFNDIVECYEKIRPNYPKQIFSDIIEYANFNENKKALEIGAGTGKATTPFLEAGFDVTAVEIADNMVAYLQEKFKSYNKFRTITTAFEDAILRHGGNIKENNTFQLYMGRKCYR